MMNWPTGRMSASPAKRQAYKTGFMPRRTETDRRHEEAAHTHKSFADFGQEMRNEINLKAKNKKESAAGHLEGQKERQRSNHNKQLYRPRCCHRSYFINASA